MLTVAYFRVRTMTMSPTTSSAMVTPAGAPAPKSVTAALAGKQLPPTTVACTDVEVSRRYCA